MQAFISTNVIIAPESRSCEIYFENGDIKSKLIIQILHISLNTVTNFDEGKSI